MSGKTKISEFNINSKLLVAFFILINENKKEVNIDDKFNYEEYLNNHIYKEEGGFIISEHMKIGLTDLIYENSGIVKLTKVGEFIRIYIDGNLKNSTINLAA